MHRVLKKQKQSLNGSYLAQVTRVSGDPDSLHRIQVRLAAFDGPDNQEGEVWARVATPFAGPSNGAFMIPEVGDEVLVTFINGDSRFPVVVGSLWNGNAEPPETIGDTVDKWTITGKAGTRIAIEEPEGGSPSVKITTPGGVSTELTDMGGGKIQCSSAGTTITIDPSGVEISCPSRVSVQASTVEVSAGMVTVDTAMATFSGVVQCNTLIATSVVSSSYTPGAGNVW